MKHFIQLTILLSMIASPFTGYCSYRRDVYESKEGELGYRLSAVTYSKCLLLSDMINNTKDKKKKKQLKTALEVELLYNMDSVLYDIEDGENDLAYQNRERDKAATQEKVEYLDKQILRTQQEIEQYHWSYGELEALLKHTR